MGFNSEVSSASKSGYGTKVCLFERLVVGWIDATTIIVCCLKDKVEEKDLCSSREWGRNSLFRIFYWCGSLSGGSLFVLCLFYYLSVSWVSCGPSGLFGGFPFLFSISSYL